ncbi:MAG: PilN domain-containing protein [Mycobacteriales bacterium]
MTTQTLQTAPMTAAPPRVNLMPPEIAEAERFRQVQFILAGAVLLAVVVVGFLSWNAHSKVASAKSELQSAQDAQAGLQSKLASLASVRTTFAEVQAKQSLLAQAMGTEVRWSFVLNNLSFRMPSNVWLTSMAVSQTPGGTATAGPSTLGGAAPAPVAVQPIGTVTFSGVGLKHDDVAAWLDAMAKVTGFTNPIFNSSQEATINNHPTVNFGGSVTMTSALYSHRFSAPAAAAAATQPGVAP